MIELLIALQELQDAWNVMPLHPDEMQLDDITLLMERVEKVLNLRKEIAENE